MSIKTQMHIDVCDIIRKYPSNASLVTEMVIDKLCIDESVVKWAVDGNRDIINAFGYNISIWYEDNDHVVGYSIRKV